MLDLYFKKYAWTAHLVLLFAAAWLAARTLNTVLAALVRPVPTVNLSARGGASSRAAEPAPTIAPERLYALLGQKPPETPAQAEPEVGAAAPRTCADAVAAPARSSLRVQLVGGVLAEDPRASMVSITDLGTRETRVYGVGDAVQGATLLSVERLRDPADPSGKGFKIAAILCDHGQKTYLDFEGDEVATASAGGSSLPPPPGFTGGQVGAAPPVDGVRRVTENRYEVKKKYIDDTLSNLSTVATQARIVPSFKNGVANGFKVFSIQPGSLYSAMGVENGDVIQRINGYEMNSPDKALEIYQKLRESSHISVEIERNGQTIRKEFNISGS